MQHLNQMGIMPPTPPQMKSNQPTTPLTPLMRRECNAPQKQNFMPPSPQPPNDTSSRENGSGIGSATNGSRVIAPPPPPPPPFLPPQPRQPPTLSSDGVDSDVVDFRMRILDEIRCFNKDNLKNVSNLAHFDMLPFLPLVILMLVVVDLSSPFDLPLYRGQK